MKAGIDPIILISFSELIKQFYSYRSGALQKLGISMIHCKMLHLLADHNGINQQEIVDMTSVSRSTMSETLTQMAQAGLIERKMSEEDRRMSLIYLTEKGWEKAEQIKKYFQEYCNDCMRNFTEEEICQFDRLLKKFCFDNERR